jgi:hypothetical protein
MLCLERLLWDKADHAELAEQCCWVLRIRKEKLYGGTRGIGELRRDASDLTERRKLQRDRIAPGAMVGDRVGELCAIVQRNIGLLVRRIREWDGPAALPPPTALRVRGGLSGEGATPCLAQLPFTQ